MRIEGIEITHHRIALDPPFPAAWDSRPRLSFDATIVRVHTDEGLTGVGSGTDMAGFEAYAHLFLGQDAGDLERHHAVLDNIAFHAGRCWPLDVALWDLEGKAQGKPVYRLLGGTEGRVRAYASTGVLRDGPAMAEQAVRLAALGFRALKLRFGRADWRQDVAVVEAVRAALGEDVDILVDCNQGWRMPWDTGVPWDLGRAREVAGALEPLGVAWIEEPLHRGDYAAMAELRRTTAVAVAGGEMARERHELRTLIEGGCVDVLQPDCVLSGGITGLRDVAARAREAGLRFTPHTWGNGIGLLANLHLAAGGGVDSDYLEFPFDPPEWTSERRDFMLVAPIAADGDGCLRLPDAPGLGIALDEARLRRTRIG